jgi:hypothetical protein
MSRTNRGGKGPGYEYWSRRLGGAPIPGKFNKKRTHKIERAANPEIIKQELVEIGNSNENPCVICGIHHTWEPDEAECEDYVIDLFEKWELRHE